MQYNFSRFSVTHAFIALLVFVVAGCASVPKKLVIPEGTKHISFEQVQQNEGAFIGEQARWGGVVASVENLTESTVIEVVHFALQSNAKPKKKNES